MASRRQIPSSRLATAFSGAAFVAILALVALAVGEHFELWSLSQPVGAGIVSFAALAYLGVVIVQARLGVVVLHARGSLDAFVWTFAQTPRWAVAVLALKLLVGGAVVCASAFAAFGGFA